MANYVIARRLGESGSRALLALGVGLNVAILAFFKYAGLLTSTAADIGRATGLTASHWDGLHVLLPLAISFFTFEMISVLVDVHRGQTRVGGFVPFAAYKSFFPKLLSGPITRYAELVPQIETPRRLEPDRFRRALALFAVGLFKKLALANNLALVADPVFDRPGSASAAVTAAGVLAFGLQILFDFSAYTDMARALAAMLGFDLPRNFRLPYAAMSPREFWRRWHMSLSRWLRDYLYIPLGGNRRGGLRRRLNVMATMVIGGLWHGAGWHFAFWGAAHGALLAADPRRRREPGRLRGAVGWALTTLAVVLLWIPFRAHSISDAVDVLRGFGHFSLSRRSFGFGELTPLWGGRASAILVIVLLAAAYAAFPVAARFRERLDWVPGTAQLAAATVLCWTLALALAPTTTRPFIYFRF